MRTSLNEIKEIEAFLHGEMRHDESLLFEARLLTQPTLKLNTMLQQKINRLVNLFHRKCMKQDLEKVHHRLFTDPSKAEFQKSILQLFNS